MTLLQALGATLLQVVLLPSNRISGQQSKGLLSLLQSKGGRETATEACKGARAGRP